MKFITTKTAPQATLLELILIRNKIPVTRSEVLAGEEKYERFEVSDEFDQDWLNNQLEIQRKRLRKHPDDYVTFIEMTLQVGRLNYNTNKDNLVEVREQLRSWIMDIRERFIAAGQMEQLGWASEFLNKLDDSTAQNVMAVYEEVLLWEGGLD